MFNRFLSWRSFFYVVALVILVVTLFYTRYVSRKILDEEHQRVEEWVLANKAMQQAETPGNIALSNMVIINNEDMPLIATDEKGQIVDYRNFDSSRVNAEPGYLEKRLADLKEEHPPIDWEIVDSPRVVYKVYYGNTALLKEIQYYPLVQLVVVALFTGLLLALITTRHKSTQNQLWAGMAKETAHQMGTPITSLRGWVEMLKEQMAHNDVVVELEKDVERLMLVSDRFSKIGSQPQLENYDLGRLLQDSVEYMKRRAPGKILFDVQLPTGSVEARISPTLINWVMENLLKNALDAMEGVGKITVKMKAGSDANLIIDVIDTGKGISAGNLQRVFQPGFTTKKRGWGLGLTLCKRIVEQYHAGQLFVKQSSPGEGTTFRMILPR
ncbi:MAG TPA: HAMP domain-containing sensor histidine kinase [Phnomibacter sp.]|nr:HAMP domain-containing sensor histidine kinase [Phnomibacter sp.]